MKLSKKLFLSLLVMAVGTSSILSSCEGDKGEVGPQGDQGEQGPQGPAGEDGEDLTYADVDIDTIEFTSITPAFITVKDVSDVTVKTLFSSEDQLPLSSNYVFGGSADGAGLVDMGDKGYWYFVNNEDNYAISKIVLNKDLVPVHGSYVLNSSASGTRLCSGSMAYPDIHGFGPLFFSAGESGRESQIKRVDVLTANAGSAGIPRPITEFGRWNAENAAPIPSAALASLNGVSTMVIIGDDDGSTGNLGMYASGSTGDLVNGRVYFLKRDNENQIETQMEEGETYDVTWEVIENAAAMSGEQINNYIKDNGGLEFGRVEDVDYRKGSGDAGREVWFNVTGTDGDNNVSLNGRVYKLYFDDVNDFTSAKLTCVIDGDVDNNGAMFHNPDNICVTENYVYIQEDPNGYNRGNAPSNGQAHAAYVYQYDIANNTIKVAFEINQMESYGGGAPGDWEYGSLIDITDIVKSTTPKFMLGVQAHKWHDAKFKGADGGAIRPGEDQGSQVLLIEGLGR